MKLSEEEFEHHARRMLHGLGLSFQGIRLRCRQCGQHGMAHNLELARMFGWVDVEQLCGSRYEGTCIECVSEAKPRQP